MDGLTIEEKSGVLRAAKKIHEHKLLQIKGYRALVKKATDERIKQLLIQICDDEEKHVEFWSERIQALGGEPKEVTKEHLGKLKVGFMMRILDTKGFFEWTVVGEEEGIQDLAIQAEKIRDIATSETWNRFASDERIHLERMKTEVLGMEMWEIRGGGGVRDMIFGANDGLVSTLAFVAGVFGAITDSYLVLLSGLAELIAGTISMGIGSYQSAKSEVEVLEREIQKEITGKGMTSKEEIEELIRFYQAEGFRKGEAEAIVKRIMRERGGSIQPSALEELGLAPKEVGNPVKSGVLCGLFFGLGALVPIFPFILPISIWEALIISVIGTVATLFGVGAMKTIFSRKSWIRSGLKMMLIGASAAAISYLIGKLFSFIL